MARTPRAGAHPGLRLAMIRRLHLYIGVFIAPSVLFFALTGTLQIFSLHEAHGAYSPPALIEGLAKVHKDQVFAVEAPDADAPGGGAGHGRPPGGDHHDDQPTMATYALKWFFAIVAAGLVTSTCLGLWMALVAGRDRAVSWLLLLAGAVVPILLVVL